MLGKLSGSLKQHINKIESIRKSRVLIIAASNIDNELLPQLYEQVKSLGYTSKLDVVIHTRGGVVNVARRIAILLQSYTKHLTFIVPYFCESSGTILTLSANEIIAGELAIFTPIDPHLHGGFSGQEMESSMSSLDIKTFGDMCQQWFGIDKQEATTESLQLLCQSIFPPTLTAFYRTTVEIETIATELLNFQLPQASKGTKNKIIQQLIAGYHSHNYAITREEMSELGLLIKSNSQIESIAWDISVLLQQHIGGGLRDSIDSPWFDALLMNKNEGIIRQQNQQGFMPKWLGICH